MSTPSCRRMPPRWDDLRPCRANTGQNAADPGKSPASRVVECFASGPGPSTGSGQAFSRAVRSLTRNWASAPEQAGAEAQALYRCSIGTAKDRALIQSSNRSKKQIQRGLKGAHDDKSELGLRLGCRGYRSQEQNADRLGWLHPKSLRFNSIRISPSKSITCWHLRNSLIWRRSKCLEWKVSSCESMA